MISIRTKATFLLWLQHVSQPYGHVSDVHEACTSKVAYAARLAIFSPVLSAVSEATSPLTRNLFHVHLIKIEDDVQRQGKLGNN